MLKLRVLLAAALLASLTSPAFAATYDVNIVHSRVAFFIDHLGFSKIIGVVNDFEGTFDFDATKPEASALNVELKVASISTNNGQRVADIQGADWFNATEFPEIAFVGKTFKKVSGTTGTITGDLSFAGATHGPTGPDLEAAASLARLRLKRDITAETELDPVRAASVHGRYHRYRQRKWSCRRAPGLEYAARQIRRTCGNVNR